MGPYFGPMRAQEKGLIFFTHFLRKCIPLITAVTTGILALNDDLHMDLGLHIKTQMGKLHPDF